MRGIGIGWGSCRKLDKVARTYLYASWSCFLIAFFGRKDSYDFWNLKND